MLHLLRQGQRPHEVAQIVGHGMKLEAHLVVAELAIRQPRRLDGVFAFLDELLRRAPVIVKDDNPTSTLPPAKQPGTIKPLLTFSAAC